MWAIARKEFRQLGRDRRTLAMLLLLPLLFLVVFGYAASFDIKRVSTVVVGPYAAAVAGSGRLPAALDVTGVRPGDGRAAAADLLRRGDAVVAIVTPSSPQARSEILVDGTELFAAQAALRAVAAAQSGAGPAPATTRGGRPSQALETALRNAGVRVLFNPGLRTAVIMIPGLCGVVLVFVGTIATALGVVRERQAGTMEQLAVMPFRARDIFLGKIAPYLLIAAVDMVVVVVVGMSLFDVPFRGSVLTFVLGAALFLFVTLGLGVLISTVSQTQGQAIQLAIMVMLPQILLSGLFFPLASMAPAVRWIGYLLPLTYFIKIARGVMVRGTPIGALWVPLLVLALMGALVFGLSTLRFRRDLAPAQSPSRGGTDTQSRATGPAGQDA